MHEQFDTVDECYVGFNKKTFLHLKHIQIIN